MLFELLRAISDPVFWNRLHCTGMEGLQGVGWEHMVMEAHGLDWKHHLEGGLINMVGASVCILIHLIIFKG